MRVNCQLRGEPAQIVIDLKRRGLVSSTREAVVQALLVLHQKILERDLQMAQLKAARRLDQGP